MSGLSKIIDEPFRNGSLNIDDMKVLPLVKVYDGKKGYQFIEKNCNKDCKDMQLGETHVCYGSNAEVIGEKMDRCKFLKANIELYCPVAIVLDAQRLKYDKVYPFDSVEYDYIISNEKNGYEECFPKEDFELGNEIEAIQKYIVYFYETNRQYFDHISRFKGGDEMCSPIVDYLECMHQSKSINAKMQTICVMISIESPIIEYVKCIILPKKMMRYDVFRELEQKTEIVFKTYKTKTHEHPALYNRDVQILLEEYLIETGTLEDVVYE